MNEARIGRIESIRAIHSVGVECEVKSARENPPLIDRLIEVRKELEGLHGTIDDLTVRLEHVLDPRIDGSGDADPDKPRPVCAPAVDHAVQLADSVSVANKRLQALLQRIQ